MVNLITERPNLLSKFLERFRGCFSNPLFTSFCFYVPGLFLELKRTNIQAITFNSPVASYENLQYFISEGVWDPEEVNSQRIKILQSSRTTKTCRKGVFVIDDTSCKKWGIYTEGARPQHCGTEDEVTNCNVLVNSAYCDTKKQYPINLRPYITEDDPFTGGLEFKSKIELAMELIDDALEKNLLFSDVVFDSWYFAKEIISLLEKKNLCWITEADADRQISYHGKWVRADELVKLIPCTKFNRRVTVPTSNGKKRSFLFSAFETKVKGIDRKVKVVVAMGSWNERDTKKVHVFVTNHLSLSDEDVIKKYALRWKIECIFRDLKENVGFDQYQVRKIKGICRHWHLSCLAYTFLLWTKQNGYFSRIFNYKLKTIGEHLQAFRKLNSAVSIKWINQNREIFREFLGIHQHLPVLVKI